tara:strand:+ start:16051 stop:16224 length:174 start_codon:yes stop_codon:yes gene_type:complete
VYEYIHEIHDHGTRGDFERWLGSFGDQGWIMCGFHERLDPEYGIRRSCVFMREVKED